MESAQEPQAQPGLEVLSEVLPESHLESEAQANPESENQPKAEPEFKRETRIVMRTGLSSIFKEYRRSLDSPLNKISNAVNKLKFAANREDDIIDPDAEFPRTRADFEYMAKFNAEVGPEIIEVFDADIAREMDKEKVRKFYAVDIPENINSSQCLRRLTMKKKKFVLIDLSGTLHIEDTPTYNASKALNLLRTAGIKVLFVTNTTKESKRILHERLIRIGFQIKMDELFTNMTSSRRYIDSRGLRPMLLLADEAMEDFEGVNVENPNSVLVGLSMGHFVHDKLSIAFRLLLEEHTELLAIHKGRSYKTSTGTSIGPGPFIVALECSTEKTATILGKPEAAFFKSALEFVGCEDSDEAVMIGDDIRDDVIGAQKVEITGILVQTGKYSAREEEKILPVTPDFRVKHFSEAVDLILETIADNLGIRKNLSQEVRAHSIKQKRDIDARNKSLLG